MIHIISNDDGVSEGDLQGQDFEEAYEDYPMGNGTFVKRAR